MSASNNHKRRHSAAVVFAACLCLLSGSSVAELSSSSQPPDAPPAFSRKASEMLGIYESVPVHNKIAGGATATPATLDALPLTPAAATSQASAKLGPDPKDACQVLGPLRLMARPDIRFEILRDPPNKLVMLFENDAWGHVRTIRIDAQHINFTKVRPMWNGDSVATWDDATLVVDTTHFTNKTWLNELGTTNSKQLHLTERFRMVDAGRYLEYQATAIDPDVLAQPVTYTRYFKRTTQEIREYNCFSHKPASGSLNR